MAFNDQPDTANPPDDTVDMNQEFVQDFLQSPSPNDFEDPTSSDFAPPPSSSSVVVPPTVISSSSSSLVHAAKTPHTIRRAAEARIASQTTGSTLPVPPPPSANPFRNINPSDIGDMDKLIDYTRALAENSKTIHKKFSDMGRDLFGKETRRLTSAMRLEAVINRLHKEAKSDDGVSPGAALLGHNFFNWKLNTKAAEMPDDTKLPHQTDPAFAAAALLHNKQKNVALAGHQEGYVVARNTAAAMERKNPDKPHHPRTIRLAALFGTEEGRVWERANGGNTTGKVGFKDGPRAGTMKALDDALQLAAAANSDDELKAAIGAPEDAINFKAVAAARATYEPQEDGDVATASKTAFAAFAIATVALECAKDTCVSMPWIVVPESEKKRLLAADLGVGEDPETRAKKLHKAANGNPGLLFFYMLQNGNKF